MKKGLNNSSPLYTQEVEGFGVVNINLSESGSNLYLLNDLYITPTKNKVKLKMLVKNEESLFCGVEVPFTMKFQNEIKFSKYGNKILLTYVDGKEELYEFSSNNITYQSSNTTNYIKEESGKYKLFDEDENYVMFSNIDGDTTKYLVTEVKNKKNNEIIRFSYDTNNRLVCIYNEESYEKIEFTYYEGSLVSKIKKQRNEFVWDDIYKISFSLSADHKTLNETHYIINNNGTESGYLLKKYIFSDNAMKLRLTKETCLQDEEFEFNNIGQCVSHRNIKKEKCYFLYDELYERATDVVVSDVSVETLLEQLREDALVQGALDVSKYIEEMLIKKNTVYSFIRYKYDAAGMKTRVEDMKTKTFVSFLFDDVDRLIYQSKALKKDVEKNHNLLFEGFLTPPVQQELINLVFPVKGKKGDIFTFVYKSNISNQEKTNISMVFLHQNESQTNVEQINQYNFLTEKDGYYFYANVAQTDFESIKITIEKDALSLFNFDYYFFRGGLINCYKYNESNKVTTILAGNNLTKFSLENGRVINNQGAVCEYYDDGKIKKIIDAYGNETEYEYSGKNISKTKRTNSAFKSHSETNYSYNAYGQRVKTTKSYVPNIETKEEYLRNNMLSKVQLIDNDDGKVKKKEYTYSTNDVPQPHTITHTIDELLDQTSLEYANKQISKMTNNSKYYDLTYNSANSLSLVKFMNKPVVSVTYHAIQKYNLSYLSDLIKFKSYGNFGNTFFFNYDETYDYLESISYKENCFDDTSDNPELILYELTYEGDKIKSIQSENYNENYYYDENKNLRYVDKTIENKKTSISNYLPDKRVLCSADKIVVSEKKSETILPSDYYSLVRNHKRNLKLCNFDISKFLLNNLLSTGENVECSIMYNDEINNTKIADETNLKSFAGCFYGWDKTVFEDLNIIYDKPCVIKSWPFNYYKCENMYWNSVDNMYFKHGLEFDISSVEVNNQGEFAFGFAFRMTGNDELLTSSTTLAKLCSPSGEDLYVVYKNNISGQPEIAIMKNNVTGDYLADTGNCLAIENPREWHFVGVVLYENNKVCLYVDGVNVEGQFSSNSAHTKLIFGFKDYEKRINNVTEREPGYDISNIFVSNGQLLDEDDFNELFGCFVSVISKYNQGTDNPILSTSTKRYNFINTSSLQTLHYISLDKDCFSDKGLLPLMNPNVRSLSPLCCYNLSSDGDRYYYKDGIQELKYDLSEVEEFSTDISVSLSMKANELLNDEEYNIVSIKHELGEISLYHNNEGKIVVGKIVSGGTLEKTTLNNCALDNQWHRLTLSFYKIVSSGSMEVEYYYFKVYFDDIAVYTNLMNMANSEILSFTIGNSNQLIQNALYKDVFVVNSTVSEIQLREFDNSNGKHEFLTHYDYMGNIRKTQINNKNTDCVILEKEYNNLKKNNEIDEMAEEYPYVLDELTKINNENSDHKYYEHTKFGLLTEITTKDEDDRVIEKEVFTYEKDMIKTHYIQSLNKTFEYTYDSYGNLVKTIEGASVNNFVYDLYNRLTSVNGLLVEYDDTGFFYPKRIGNDTLHWQGDRLISYVKEGKTYQYDYDINGLRILKKCNEDNSVLRYFYDCEGKLVLQSKENTITKTKEDIYFLYNAENNLYGFNYNGNNYYYLKDCFNTIYGIIDNEGNVIVKYKYTAYGQLISVVDGSQDNLSQKNPFLYKGYYYDVETQLYWVSSRYYSPELGRFIQPANVSTLNPHSINGLNLYAYANNNPIVRAKSPNIANVGMISSLKTNTILSTFKLPVVNYDASNSNYWDLHTKGKWLDTDWPTFLSLSNDGFEVVNWSLSIYKGSLYFDNQENHSLYFSFGNISIFAGLVFPKDSSKDNKTRFGFDASANVIEIGYDGRILDASVSVLTVGATCLLKDGKFKLEYGYGWWGWSVSIDFIELFKWLFGGE